MVSPPYNPAPKEGFHAVVFTGPDRQSYPLSKGSLPQSLRDTETLRVGRATLQAPLQAEAQDFSKAKRGGVTIEVDSPSALSLFVRPMSPRPHVSFAIVWYPSLLQEEAPPPIESRDTQKQLWSSIRH